MWYIRPTAGVREGGESERGEETVSMRGRAWARVAVLSEFGGRPTTYKKLCLKKDRKSWFGGSNWMPEGYQNVTKIEEKGGPGTVSEKV